MYHIAVEEEVLGEASCVDRTKRKCAAPAIQAGQLPASNHRIEQTSCICSQGSAASKRQFVNPVEGDHVAQIEVGWRTIQAGIPRVRDVAENGALPERDRRRGGSCALRVNALSIGSQVDGLRIGIAEIYLQAVAHRMAHNELGCVVTAGPKG